MRLTEGVLFPLLCVFVLVFCFRPFLAVAQASFEQHSEAMLLSQSLEKLELNLHLDPTGHHFKCLLKR